MWVHCDSIIWTIACYGIGTVLFLMVIVNIEYDVIVFIARHSVFQIWIVFAEFGSSRCCWTTWSLFLCMSAVWGVYWFYLFILLVINSFSDVKFICCFLKIFLVRKFEDRVTEHATDLNRMLSIYSSLRYYCRFIHTQGTTWKCSGDNGFSYVTVNKN